MSINSVGNYRAGLVKNPGAIVSRHAAERRACRRRIDGPERYKIESVIAAETNPCSIQKIGTDGVTLFEHHSLPPGMRIEDDVIETIWLLEVRVGKQVRPEENVVRRKLVIHTDGIEMFRHNL